MQLYLARNKVKSGPYTRFQVMEKLAAKEFNKDDFGWHEGLDHWRPLHEIPAFTSLLDEIATANESPQPPAQISTEPAAASAASAAALDCSQVRPFVRFFARFLDLFVFSSLVWIVIGAHQIPEPPKTPEDLGPFLLAARRILLIEAGILFAWNFLDAWLLSTYGTTLGKYLLRVQVRHRDGSLLSYRAALQRSLHIWMSGYAFGLPILRELIKILCYVRLVKEGITPWDRAQDLLVVHHRIGERRIAVAALLFLVVALLLNLATAGQ